MKVFQVDVTADDLKHDVMSTTDCPGFRAIKRVLPELKGFYICNGYFTHPVTKEITNFYIPDEVGDKLSDQLNHQENPQKYHEIQPFSFTFEIEDYPDKKRKRVKKNEPQKA